MQWASWTGNPINPSAELPIGPACWNASLYELAKTYKPRHDSSKAEATSRTQGHRSALKSSLLGLYWRDDVVLATTAGLQIQMDDCCRT